MKKIIALVLALALTLGCCAALAEENAKTQLGVVDMTGAFKLQCTLPEGYEINIEHKDNEGLSATIASGDEGKPTLYLVIEFDELYYHVKRMNDMTEEQLMQIVDTFPEDDDLDVSYTETAHGTKVMVVKGIANPEDYADYKEGTAPIKYIALLSIYEGYMIEVDIADEDGLSEALVNTVIDFMSDLDFIPESK